jgi:S1-C subfamily serine protease
MASRSQLALLGIALWCVSVPSSWADTLKIASTPSGASVEINGVVVGVTPYLEKVPGGYFHKTRTVLGQRLQRNMTARISLAGYATKEIQLTEGPMNWVSLKGHSHGEYWLLKARTFHFDLIPMSKAFTGSIAVDTLSEASVGAQSLSESQSASPLSAVQIVARAKPAVVRLQGGGKSGSGFFVTDTGLIATNKHLVRDQDSLLAVLATGQELDAKVVYVDSELDLAFVKADGSDFPYLSLAETNTVRQGNTVIAIGNPGGGMPFSVTKGIVSGIAKFPSAGPGLWIQTDASINPGNSGGPLLNTKAEVVGINTVKIGQKGTSGIGFALSAVHLIAILHRYYPSSEVSAEELAVSTQDEKLALPSALQKPDLEKFGTIEIREPETAAIYINGNFVGEIPSSLPLVSGKSYRIVVRAPGRADWVRRIFVLPGMHTVLSPWAE